MTYSGIELVELTPETWDGRTRTGLCWDSEQNGGLPVEVEIIGYVPPRHPLFESAVCWHAIGRDGIVTGYRHAADYPAKGK